MSDQERTLAEKLTNYATALWAGLVVVLGLSLLVFTALISWFEAHVALKAVLNELGSVLFVTGGLAAFWDLRGKRDLIQEVLTRVRTSEEVKAAGLTGVTMDWSKIPWDEYFRSSRELSVFIAYGSSWRKVHWSKLVEFAGNSGNRLRLYLPDPGDAPTVAILAQRFDYSPEKTENLIREMAQEMAGLSRADGADIRIYYRTGDPTYTLYKFDQRFVASLYANRRTRGEVPVLTVQQGSMFEFFSQDLAAIARQSVPASLQDLMKGPKA